MSRLNDDDIARLVRDAARELAEMTQIARDAGLSVTFGISYDHWPVTASIRNLRIARTRDGIAEVVL